ncbi:enoyl-CoA hydratase-related protein [Pollutimonas sp. H1-120]|uniref:enoyl-CoA hydratase/isomerase family protein n=1 Tax=Pollutimonas sp. H1-120 TaxID=3148824 RepID=UPI003B52D3D4
MSGEIVLRRDGYVATITIDNVAKRNAMTQAMWIEMGDAVLALGNDTQLRCIVIRGKGAQAFGSGADIDEFEKIRASKAQAIEFGKHGHRAMLAVRDCPIPTIAAVQGICVGGGLELAAVCDLRVANESSRFGVPIARLGGVLAYPELEGLLRLAGPQVTLELLLEGRLMAAAEAYEKGLLTRVFADADYEEGLQKIVNSIVAGAPLSARWHKKFVARLLQGSAIDETESSEGYDCFDTNDFKEGYLSFLGKRPPAFTGT